VIDYWQRFHITLTRFITMYIFSPLALWVARYRTAHGMDASRRAATRPGGFAALVAGPTLITMGLAGVWHGAGSQYLIFGMLHGVYIVVNHAMRIFFPPPKKPPPRSWRMRTTLHVSKVLAVYVAALVAFAFFRSHSTLDALDLLAGMIGLHGVGPDLPSTTLLQIAGLFVIVWACPNVQQIMVNFEPVLGRQVPNPYPRLTWQPTMFWAAVSGVVAAVGVLALGGTTEFLYFQF